MGSGDVLRLLASCWLQDLLEWRGHRRSSEYAFIRHDFAVGPHPHDQQQSDSWAAVYLRGVGIQRLQGVIEVAYSNSNCSYCSQQAKPSDEKWKRNNLHHVQLGRSLRWTESNHRLLHSLEQRLWYSLHFDRHNGCSHDFIHEDGTCERLTLRLQGGRDQRSRGKYSIGCDIAQVCSRTECSRCTNQDSVDHQFN